MIIFKIVSENKKKSDTRTCDNCKDILEELEKIDDDANKYGVEFVKNSERAASKKYGINQFPTLVYFRHGEPTIYEGNHKFSSFSTWNIAK